MKRKICLAAMIAWFALVGFGCGGKKSTSTADADASADQVIDNDGVVPDGDQVSGDQESPDGVDVGGTDADEAGPPDGTDVDNPDGVVPDTDVEPIDGDATIIDDGDAAPPEDADTADQEGDAPQADVPDTNGPTSCEQTIECPGLQTCDDGAKICENASTCVDNQDCVSGFICFQGACIDLGSVPPGKCVDNNQCVGNGICNPATHQCVNKEICKSDNDCADGYRCFLGEARCVQCWLPSHCPNNICTQFLECAEPPFCSSSTVCLDGKLCKGKCSNGQSCDGGTKCPDDKMCQASCVFPVNADDPFEENDTQIDAKDLDVGTHSDLTINTGDDDWYKITVPADKSLVVSVSYDHSVGELGLTLFTSDGRFTLDTMDGVAGFALVKVGEQSASETVYLVRVELLFGNVTSYTLDVALVDKPFCKADILDSVKSNDNANDATPVSSFYDALNIEGFTLGDEWKSLTICGADEDWYKLELPKGSALVVETTFANSGRPAEIAVFRKGALTSPLGIPTNAANNRRVDLAVGASDTYYVRINSTTGNLVYDLKINWTWSCNANDDEPNQTPDDAKAVTLDTTSGCWAGTSADCRQLCEADTVDWYSVQVPKNTQVAAKIRYHARGGFIVLDVEIYDSDKSTKLAGSPVVPTGTAVVERTALINDSGPAAKTIYIKVLRGSFGTLALYDLEIVTGGGICTDDSREDGDDTRSGATTANLMPTVNEGQFCQGDIGDYFKVDLESGDTLYVDLFHPKAPGALTLNLYAPNAPTTAIPGTTFPPVTAFGTRAFISNVSTTGTYHIEIKGSSSTPYALHVTRIPAIGCVGDDGSEPNDTASLATKLDGTNPSPLMERAVCLDVPDWYVIDLQTSNSATVTFDGNVAGKTFVPMLVRLFVVGDTMALVTGKNTTFQNMSVTFTLDSSIVLQSGARYYFLVTGENDEPTYYNVSYSVQ